MSAKAVVLLSGGMDSVAVLHWANDAYDLVQAALFDYGQPNRDQELISAGRAARHLGIVARTIVLADALPRARGILCEVEDFDGREDGLSPAFVPGRNILMIASAAAHGSIWFPNGSFDVVVGCNGQDAKRFPDCSAGALVKLSQALRHGVAREINIVAPYNDRTKLQILESLSGSAIAAVRESWSCYRNHGPCGSCAACVLRAKAFHAAGIVDLCTETKMVGGDPSRAIT